MKAVIMAAGKGTRMLPLTETMPKVLIPINGKPFLHYVIDNLQKAGFRQFGIIAGHMKEQIEKFVKDNDINATVIEQKEQLGTGHALAQAHKFCGDDENFLLQGGDNLFSVADLKQMINHDWFHYIMAKEVENPDKYGVMVVKEDRLVEIIEKPKEYVSNLVNTGLYKLTPEIWKVLPKLQKSPRGEYELTDAITTLAKIGKVKVMSMKGYWLDLGCKEDIPKIEEFLRIRRD